MPDAIPKGYITLRETFERLYQQRTLEIQAEKADQREERLTGESGSDFKSSRSSRDLERKTLDKLVSAFREEKLIAYVSVSGRADIERVPKDIWDQDDFAAILFLGKPIDNPHTDEPWHLQHGRTPLLKEKDFLRWSNREPVETTKRGPGRPNNSGAIDYTEVIAIAKSGLTDGRYKSLNDAAVKLAPEHWKKFATSEQAFTKRLPEKFRKAFPGN